MHSLQPTNGTIKVRSNGGGGEAENVRSMERKISEARNWQTLAMIAHLHDDNDADADACLIWHYDQQMISSDPSILFYSVWWLDGSNVRRRWFAVDGSRTKDNGEPETTSVQSGTQTIAR